MDDVDTDEAWDVYERFCSRCGRKIVLVATVHSVENGYAEGMKDDLVCMACEALEAMNVN